MVGPATEDLPLVDTVTFGAQTTDVAYLRSPDGGEWTTGEPSPAGSNP